MTARRGRSALAALAVTALVLGLLVAGGVWVSQQFRDAVAPGLRVACTATVGDASYSLSPEQAGNAALISAISLQRGLPARAASIALATALQESRLINIDYGDLDSVGLFQQRTSQDWGTVAQIMDPVYSATAFYQVLETVPNYEALSLNDAAQIVQRSGYPHAYAQHEGMARTFASALTGQTPAALSCTLEPGIAVSTPAVLEAAADAQFGPLPFAAVPGEGSAELSLTVAAGGQGWAVAAWAVAHAQQYGLTAVAYDGQVWERDANDGRSNRGWQPLPADAAETGANTGTGSGTGINSGTGTVRVRMLVA